MSKFLITVEVDTDRDLYGSAWGANYGGAKHTDEDILKGGLISTDWDHPPFMRVLDTLDADAVALIAATFDADRHPGQIEAPDETWAKVRAVFAPSLAPAEDAVGFTRIA